MLDPDRVLPDGDDPDDAYAPGDLTVDDLDPAELGRLVDEMATVVDKPSALAFYDRLAGH